MTGEWEAESALRSLLHHFVEERYGGGYETPWPRNGFVEGNAVSRQGGSGAAGGHVEEVDDEIGEF